MQKNRSFSGKNRIWVAVIFGLVFAICPLLFIAPNIIGGDEPFLLVAIIVPFVLVGLGFAGYGLVHYYSRARVGKPEIMISNETLRVGESFTVNLMHTFKRSVQIDHIKVQLVFRETATYQQGTDTRTVTHNNIIEDYELPSGKFTSGHFIQETFNMQIPAAGMHTLSVRRNALRWFVCLDLGIPKLPDYVDEYELTVRPEMK